MIGVSPSFFFSKYTTDFSIDDYIDGLSSLKKLGVESFQGEIYQKKRIEEWKDKSYKLASISKSLNLKMNIFVAHFLIHVTESFDSLFDESCFEDFAKVCALVKANFLEVKTIIIPISRFENKDIEKEEFSIIWERVVHIFKTFAQKAKEYDFNLALEILPGSIIGGSDGLLKLIEDTNADNLGYNLDTGHAYCSGEILSLLPSKLNGKIYSTHLKDNFGKENLSLSLGKGDIDFKTLNQALILSGYKGSYDLEISSNKENVMMDYSIGVSYLRNNNIGN
ncbi:MAG: sugar phosphate isomerase/epimerase [Sphaerochaetaceae bacterium]|nr:sugar phosphate isomerase/epimerase [Sphaerochaetaceae bacterium]MDC7236248.1 sugar phosphate isomerase/epimerase [Sphaerochaetaceae bacterium]